MWAPKRFLYRVTYPLFAHACCRCDAADVASSLECLSLVLQEQQLHLLMLPLLAVWEHTTLYITHDRAATVLARITRVKALAALGLMPQAASILQTLMQGAHLPGLLLGPTQPLLDQNGLAVDLAQNRPKGHAGESKGAASGAAAAAGALDDADDGRRQLYCAGQWCSHPSNTDFLQFVAEGTLDAAVVQAYGPWLCGHLDLARAAFLTAAGAAVKCWVSSRPSQVAADVMAGPPQPAAADGEPNSCLPTASSAASASTAAAPAAQTSAAATTKGGKSVSAAAAAAAASAAQAGAAVTQKASTGAIQHAPGASPPSDAERKLLGAAAHLLQGVIVASCSASGTSAASLGLPWAEQGPPDNSTAAPAKAATTKDKPGHGSSTAAKGTQKQGKGGRAHAQGSAGGQQHEAQGADDAAAADIRAAAAAETLAAQHQQLLVDALLQLVAVQAARWLPLQALPVCLAACEAVKQAASATSMTEAKSALQPSSSAWLAARLQASILAFLV